ncbi:MAG: replication-associated recombination protein A [Victivallaceae bacterium]|nr:replication-associated recombination protein A [Victivallaceae bacterium]
MEQIDFLDAESNSGAGSGSPSAIQPLAARLRPRNLDEYAGQKHLLAEGKLLRRAVEADRFSSIILSGPPGTGKTSLAGIIAATTNSEFVRLSGVTSTVADIRREVSCAVTRYQLHQRRTILFIDEIHRFSKSQQDSLLPDVENGNIRLIGATTHNPQFYVIGALLSRSMVFILESLSEEDILDLLKRAVNDPRAWPPGMVNLDDDAAHYLATASEGDARRALNALELAVDTTPASADGTIHVTRNDAAESIQKKIAIYGDDGHYDTASAFIKSMRGSDPDAAVYYLARMLDAGEDIRFIARRIVIFASEDIGNADPRAITLAVSAMQGVDFVGLPEAKLILAQAVTYCATAPKSNASTRAISAALDDVQKNRVQPIPYTLRDTHSAGGKEHHHQEGYIYPHSTGGFAAQDYMTVPRKYYEILGTGAGYETKIKERLNYWEQLRKEAGHD